MSIKKFIFALLVLIMFAGSAQAKGFSTIRDEEIETYLKTIANPIFEAAGLNSDRINIHIVNDEALNAFVAGGSNLFIHTGLILESDDPSMLMGVIAHESGHIASGHLIKKSGDAKRAGMKATLGYLLGIGSMIVGAPPEAAAVIVSGGQHVAERGFLKHSRAHEESADRSALDTLKKINASPKGLMNLLEKLNTEATLRFGDDLNPYALTHPLSSERISHIRSYLLSNPEMDIPPPASLKATHQMIQAKLEAFLSNPEDMIKNIDKKYTDNDVANRYAKAIAYYRIPSIRKAVETIDELIDDYPNNPYFHELKGQILFENGKVIQSIPSYKRALSLLPKSYLLRLELATAQLALLEEGKIKHLDKLNSEIIDNLKQIVIKEPRNPFAWRQLGKAYGINKQLGMANLALAEESALLKQKDQALDFLRRADKYFVKDSPGAIRADDLKDRLLKKG